ncbi:MAG: mechanosensitive ion channel protein MscS [Actinobacteria bacterium]|nr:MAG: mechanosensitive ion channel protein MscS [Actinomycetota bacterium]
MRLLMNLLLASSLLDTTQSDKASVSLASAHEPLGMLSPTIGTLGGGLIALIAAIVLALILKKVVRSSPLMTALLTRVRRPSYWMFAFWGAVLGLATSLWEVDLKAESNGVFLAFFAHTLLIASIIATTWTFYAALGVLEDAVRMRKKADGTQSRRFETQVQVLRRLSQAIVILLGISFVILTFPGARQAMGTMLASAGVISVIAGLAAQATLKNVFAGIQLAFTDAVRVGDIVRVQEKDDIGVVEEITLAYLVVRVWDERRFVVPSNYFTTTIFENWSRRTARQVGTVELHLDWNAPIDRIRQKVEDILNNTDLWDGEKWAVQVTDSDKESVVVRVAMSAENSSTLWDLRCHVREALISWIASEESSARSMSRYVKHEAPAQPKTTARKTPARRKAPARKKKDSSTNEQSDG